MKKRSNAEEDDEFSNRETPPKAADLNKNKPSLQRLALTQGTIDDSYESDSSQSEKVEDEPSSPRPPSRKIFSSNYSIIKTRKAHALLPPGVSYPTIRFDPIQDVVNMDREGDLPVHEQAKEKGTNPYRRWGAHRALCDNVSGGFVVERTDGKVTKVTKVEYQSAIPPEPKMPTQVTMAKLSGESQTLLGSLKVQPGEADNECKRIAEEMERISWNGGFIVKETPIIKKEKKNSDEKDDEKDRRLKEKVRKQQPSKKPEEKKKKGTDRKTKGSKRKKGSDSNSNTGSGSDSGSGSKGKSKSDESAENTDEEDVGKTTKKIKKKIKSLLSPLTRSKGKKKSK